jgi:hypothetical protein
MLALQFRRALAVLFCFAGGLAYWLDYGAILRGDAFGIPFGWGFGTAVTIAFITVPLAVDRDDPHLKMREILIAFGLLIFAAVGLGAGTVLHGSPQFALGAVIGATIGGALSYWAFGEDRRKRGVPRTNAGFSRRR